MGCQEFVAAIADADQDEQESMLTWVGGSFDPDAFDAGEFEHRPRLGRAVAL